MRPMRNTSAAAGSNFALGTASAAVEPPPESRIQLAVRNLKGKRWAYRRLMLDAATASNQENDRMRAARNDTLQDAGEAKDSFDLPPYGVALVSLRRLGS